MLLTLTLLINSCAFHSGAMSGNAALSDANFTVVDYAIGTSSTSKIFGMGGVAIDALILEAKRNLYENYPLTKGQALANVSVDFKRSFFPIVSKVKVIISADIVGFNEGAVIKTKLKEFPIELDNKRENDLNINREMVYFEYQGILKLGKIIGYGFNRVKVMSRSDRDRLRIKRVSVRKLFFINKNEAILETNFNIGDEVTYVDEIVDEKGADKNVTRFGIIFGFGQKAAVIKYNLEYVSMFSVIEYKKISSKE